MTSQAFVAVWEFKTTDNDDVIINGKMSHPSSRPAGQGWAESEVRMHTTVWVRKRYQLLEDVGKPFPEELTHFELALLKSDAAYARDFAK
ncbi:hypothetical protein HUE56_19740 [Azospirillum oryzae]|uniref:Uncharacterized protein n=1 Tax=Azospirillum oryzae TaxID=286727 RepID=A0A6N1AN26_9PROT|nr:hypothetical protein [Azospirillum oryzae]KAA0591310.1 hypothetical protein FZ938_04340 [Azospirillum oryzae]QKS52598.1 hypothetical protein HUE56_19740 [Azospirillum oryzae]GLR79795.1 hypothetical protein GCM10007856_24710 [Azospirillum oryzae]